MSYIKREISIPTDNDGYVLLQCPFCGEFFKLKPEDCEDEGILDFYCPACGLSDENFITEDVLELALTMIKNSANDLFFNEMKKWERQFNSGPVSFKAGKNPKLKSENPIRVGVEALTITKFECCKRNAKIKLILKFSGCYCPFCGVKEFELE